MTDLSALLDTLRRPAILIRAARHALAEYDRQRDLGRLLAEGAGLSPDRAVRDLLAREAELDASRTEGAATYSIARHIEVLVALMAEARLLLSRPGGAQGIS
ncbi:hypothetical protein SAMN04490244_10139 [Tranquillimonas rosea]|uniref:Uncharacterized protein n=1 Tax=Tranquillimonas rosea TaxID=641238 RepID=A0A1H9P643_9RHOB|nr:DUF6477 family protein [Tranquillimonas rosea]SER43660.1 hypothetical protein SAMN04490244_10139 [Tranquillimonas rosea]